jgi:DNA/RNA endonuclease YhcR with UshA esterase domain
MRNYDPKTEVTVKGTVEDVQEIAGRNGRTGTHLLLKTDSGTLPVHVGPSAYILKNQFSFSKGDEISVLGSKVTIAGKETLLAREITKDGKTLVLRNAQGIPEWAGGPR